MKSKPEKTTKAPIAKYHNFKVLLDLPERLAIYLRLWFHLKKSDWDFTIDVIRQENAYKEWSKSKGRGKSRRHFAAPCEELKTIQKAILNRFLSSVSVHFIRHGGQVGSSIITNVEHHISFAKEVFAVDIVNAFPSARRSRVRACLRKPFEYGLKQFKGVEFTDEDKNLLLEAVVDLIVWKDRIPQGPPTSPRLFDIVCGKMDQELFEFTEINSTPFQSYRLTIWTDNVTLSSDGQITQEIKDGIVSIIRKNGFFVHTNEEKMQHFSPGNGTVPVITGLVIAPGSESITMAPRKVNQIRGRLNNLAKKVLWDEKTKGEAAGLLGFVRQVYPKGKNVPSKLKSVVEKTEARIHNCWAVLPSHDDIQEDNVAPVVNPKPARKKKNSVSVTKVNESVFLIN